MGKKNKKRAREDPEVDDEPEAKRPTASVTAAAPPPEEPEDLFFHLEEPAQSGPQDAEEIEKMQVLVAAFSPEQQNRYELYRRSSLPRSAVRRLMQNVSGTPIPPNAVIAMNGIAKVFVGEIVEEALDIRDSLSETGPLRPKHIREAIRRLRNRGPFQLSSAPRPFLRL